MKPEDDDEFSLGGLAKLVWRYRLLVAFCSLAAAVLAGVVAFTTKPYFRAEVVVTEVRDRGLGNVGSLANQLGGLASLAGVNLGGVGGNPGQESAAVLESHHLAEEFIRRNGILPELLHGSSKPPTIWLGVKAFTQGVLTIRKDLHKGVTTVDIEWTDPATAARWANSYVALANELVRARALNESNRNITYLNEQVAKTDSVDLRKVMYNLIENETKTLMVANGRVEYAFQVVDPAVAPEIKLGPHRLLITFIGLMVGFGLGSAVAFMVEQIRRFRHVGQPQAQISSIV
jgi:LPS O-antigen subunit length determinant protein (WzzB/FepE family)